MKTKDLTDAQRAAVESESKNILCVAGPGSGKTTVLAARIRRIVDSGADPRQVIAFTYTNAAARNLEERLGTEKTSPNGDESMPFADTPIRLGYAGTLHGFCLRMLRDHGTLFGYGARTGVIDEDASRELMAEKAEQQGSKESLDSLMKLKAQGRPLRNLGKPYSRPQLVVLAYCEELREAGLLDFDLILTEFRRLLREDVGLHDAVAGRFSHLFWDEKQDSGEADWGIAVEIPIANKFFVGDPDQSIFKFRGSAPERLLEYSQRPGVQVLYLDENFRCAAAICEAANSLIARNPNRLKKETVPFGQAFGEIHQLPPSRNEGDEVGDVLDVVRSELADKPDSTIAILCRSNAIADGFRAALNALGFDVEEDPRNELPADWSLARALIEFLAQPNSDTLGFFYFAAREVKRGATAIEARRKAHTIRSEATLNGKTIAAQWFDFVKDHRDNGSTANFVGRMMEREGVSRESVALVVERMKDLPAGSTLTDLALAVVRQSEPAAKKKAQITVTSIHAAKGREWDAVIVAGYEDQLTPGHAKSADIEEERRLGFVAITRARRSVFFSSAKTRRANWGNRPVEERQPSRFIAEAIG